MPSWEAERRLDYIEDTLIGTGRVNRADVMAYFGISTPQASFDLGRYAESNGRVFYCRVSKAYRWKEGAEQEPVRGSTPARRKAWAVFLPG